jgi:hypothetical protein
MKRAVLEAALATSRLLQAQSVFEAAWPRALGAWSKFTRLKGPIYCLDDDAAQRQGLSQSFAMIRLADQSIVINLADICRRGMADYGLEILAHEIGHHVLAPATLGDHARTIARMRRALPTVEQQAPMIANLYTDLLINDRLQRSASLRVDHVYRLIGSPDEPGAVWQVYLRIYEVLWSLPRGTLVPKQIPDALEGDAWLGARLVRSYARDWLDGSGRFAALMFPHLLEDQHSLARLQTLFDTKDAAVGGEPAGLSDVDPEEEAGALHPALDPRLNGRGDAEEPTEPTTASAPGTGKPGPRTQGQRREPFEYGEILRAAGLRLSDHEVAVRYYREQALPHLVPFPRRKLPESSDPLPEGLEPWGVGEPLDELDMLQSVLLSPLVVPGMTTMKRLWGTSPGNTPALEPLDLDLYVDSSGSMANPQRQVSFPALAGAILCLSALRVGSRVQATLWSGKNQFAMTRGFVRNETQVLSVLTGFFGGATAFPIHVLRDTYQSRSEHSRPVHVLVISDDGITTLFDQDEKGNSGWDVARGALERARGGGTFVLDLAHDIDSSEGIPSYYDNVAGVLRRARDELGIAIHRVTAWDQLIAFARWFSRLKYAGEA